MKKYIALAFMAASLLAVSCQDFLNKENPNAIESEHFFTGETSLELYSNGLIRGYLPSILDFINIDRYSDTQAWDGELLFYTDRFTVADQGSWSWTRLRSINYYLENLRKADCEEAVLNHYEGVGRFFRAMFYIDKLQTFGAVPWYDHVIDPADEEELYRQRDARSFIACMTCPTTRNWTTSRNSRNGWERAYRSRQSTCSPSAHKQKPSIQPIT